MPSRYEAVSLHSSLTRSEDRNVDNEPFESATADELQAHSDRRNMGR